MDVGVFILTYFFENWHPCSLGFHYLIAGWHVTCVVEVLDSCEVVDHLLVTVSEGYFFGVEIPDSSLAIGKLEC